MDVPQPALDPYSVVILMGSLHGLVLATIIWARRSGDPWSRTLLAGFLLCGAISCAGTLLYHARFFFRFPHLAETYIPFVYLLSPLLYLYVHRLLHPEKPMQRAYLWHGLPALMYFLYLIPFYLKDGAAKVAALRHIYTELPLEWRITTGFLLVQMPIYLGFTLHILRRQRTTQGGYRMQRLWLYAFIALFGLAWLIFLLRYLTAFVAETMFWGPLTMSLGVYGIGYWGFYNRVNWDVGQTAPSSEKTRSPNARPAGGKYVKSSLTRDQRNRVAQELVRLMEEENDYRDPDLTLAKLASRTGVSRHHLSQVLNGHFQQTFFEFVNAYRIKEAQVLLRDPHWQHQKSLGIAMEVGFKSNSTFYAAFKKATGSTPKAFRQHADRD